MDDLIRRQDAIDALGEPPMVWTDSDYEIGRENQYDSDVSAIQKVAAVEAERKIGHWKRYNTYHGDDTSGFVDPDWRCSECGKSANINEWFMYDLTNYCPNCGAKMDGGKDNG